MHEAAGFISFVLGTGNQILFSKKSNTSIVLSTVFLIEAKLSDKVVKIIVLIIVQGLSEASQALSIKFLEAVSRRKVSVNPLELVE